MVMTCDVQIFGHNLKNMDFTMLVDEFLSPTLFTVTYFLILSNRKRFFQFGDSNL